MLILQTPSDLLQHVGRKLGTSDWFTIEQSHVDGFARLTGDDFWIHVDVERFVRHLGQKVRRIVCVAELPRPWRSYAWNRKAVSAA
jgi:hypothetical protein